MRKKIVFMFLLLSNFLTAQESVNMYQHDFENIKNMYTIADDVNKKSLLIVNNKEKNDFLLFDEKFNLNFKLTQVNTDNLQEYLGFSLENTTYYTYWQKSKSSIEIMALDITNKNINSTSLNFKIDKKENIINMFNYNNVFYILTVSKINSRLNFYMFKNTTFEKKSIDCSSVRMIDSESKPVDLWGFITDQNEVAFRKNFKVFDSSSPMVNIISATHKKKIFLTDKHIILVSDINKKYSQNLIIDINDFTISQKAISKFLNQTITFKDDTETNSFIIDDKIFVMNLYGESILILVRDFENNLLKKIPFSSATGNDFINSDLKEENGTITSGEIIEKKNTFFRTIADKNASISGYFENEKYYLTIAGVSYFQQQQSVYFGMFGLLGSTIGLLLQDSSQSSLPSYTDKKIVYFKSIIDNDFNGSQEKLTYSSFDKLRLFIEKDNTKKEFLEPFGFQDHLILTGLNKKEKRIIFYKF